MLRTVPPNGFRTCLGKRRSVFPQCFPAWLGERCSTVPHVTNCFPQWFPNPLGETMKYVTNGFPQRFPNLLGETSVRVPPMSSRLVGGTLFHGTDDCSAFSVCRVSGCQVVCSVWEPSWDPIETLLGPSWDPLGALLEPSWALEGASWGDLGALLGRLGSELTKKEGGLN